MAEGRVEQRTIRHLRGRQRHFANGRGDEQQRDGNFCGLRMLMTACALPPHYLS